jgi:hypothetical protein
LLGLVRGHALSCSDVKSMTDQSRRRHPSQGQGSQEARTGSDATVRPMRR